MLNSYEISFIDSLLLQPFFLRSPGTIDLKKGHDLISKIFSFYTCTLDSELKATGFISKRQFFNLIKVIPIGEAKIELIQLSEIEKTKTKGFDAIITIDCPHDMENRKKFISELSN